MLASKYTVPFSLAPQGRTSDDLMHGKLSMNYSVYIEDNVELILGVLRMALNELVEVIRKDEGGGEKGNA